MTDDEFKKFDLKDIQDKNLETAVIESKVYKLVFSSESQRVLNIWKYYVAKVEDWAEVKTEIFGKYTFENEIK